MAYGGVGTLNILSIAEKILLPLVLSPLAGLLAGYLFMLGLSWSFRNAHPHGVNTAFRKLQIVSSAFMATSHGMNDAQKTMGIITLPLFVGHHIPDLEVPFWVKVACAVVMGLGTAQGGWKIVKTMGHKIFKLESVHGLGLRRAHQHHPHHRHLGDGRGGLQAPLRGALGHRREHGRGLDPDHPGGGGRVRGLLPGPETVRPRGLSARARPPR